MDRCVVSKGYVDRADVEYVRLLPLAATTGERHVEVTLQEGAAWDYARVQALVSPPTPPVPVLHLPAPDLAQYDALLRAVTDADAPRGGATRTPRRLATASATPVQGCARRRSREHERQGPVVI